MEVTDTLYVTHREEWRRWLITNFEHATEIWLVFYRKETGRASIRYNDAVEEALCFGWIDSIRKTLGPERYAQRFTPRTPGSAYSQTNKERLARLIEQGRVAPEVLRSLEGFRADEFAYPPDIVAALRSNGTAWTNFQRFSVPYRRIRVAFVDAARGRPEEFEKRLKYLVRMTERGKQYGYGIEEYY